MADTLNKLQLKTFMQGLILNQPTGFDLSQFPKSELKIDLTACQTRSYDFVLVFLTSMFEIEAFAQKFLDGKSKMIDDKTLIWLCYPKMSSKKYKCDFNRDSGWKVLEAKYDLLPVRQVAIDEDWSALRFKFRSQISKITRRF